ncbi:MAG: response regulator [Candidatus Omnitrophica bacterium]|nr:response regulator [Candidatus Omnitrophota bacterium]
MKMAIELNSEAGTRILVVDDDIDTLQLLKIRLSGANYHVLSASSGIEALRRAKTDSPDLILLDVVMKDMSGFEVCFLLKQDIATQHIPVIMLTQKDNPEDMYKGLQSGATCYHTKPYNPSALLEEIRLAINSSFSLCK